MRMDYDTLQYEVEGEIGILTLNRPEVINAVNRKMVNELTSFWQARQTDLDVRVIVLCGAGERGFCSGVDLKEASKTGAESLPEYSDPIHMYQGQRSFSAMYRSMRTCPQPIISAVHGPAMGGGLSFALASDMRVASEDAYFCAQYVNIGLGGADMGSSYFLWRIVGAGKAYEMCLTGSRVYAEEALRIGLVNRVTSLDDLMPTAMELAEVMVSKSKMGLRLTKEALNTAINAGSIEDVMQIEDRNQIFLLSNGLMSTDIKSNS